MAADSWNMDMVVTPLLLDRDDALDQVSSFVQHSSTGSTANFQIDLSVTSIFVRVDRLATATAHQRSAPDCTN